MRECKEGQNFGIMRGKNSLEKQMVYFIGIIVGNKNKKIRDTLDAENDSVY